MFKVSEFIHHTLYSLRRIPFIKQDIESSGAGGAASSRNWQSCKLGFREPSWHGEPESQSLYLIVRAGDGRVREWDRSGVDREQASYGADISPVNTGTDTSVIILVVILMKQ